MGKGKKQRKGTTRQRGKTTTWQNAEGEIGDPRHLVFIIGTEMLVSADILNRLQLAEQEITGEYVGGSARSAAPMIPLCDDVEDALLLPREMAKKLPLGVIRKQREIWEEEVARYALALWHSLKTLIAARGFRWTATRILAKGEATGTKREATLTEIADMYRRWIGPNNKDRVRQVRRMLQAKKAQGGVYAVDRRLLWRDLTDLDALPDDYSTIPARRRRSKPRP